MLQKNYGCKIKKFLNVAKKPTFVLYKFSENFEELQVKTKSLLKFVIFISSEPFHCLRRKSSNRISSLK